MLDPGAKRRSGGYRKGATTNRGKYLEWKHAGRSPKHDALWEKFKKEFSQTRNTRASQPKRKGGRRK